MYSYTEKELQKLKGEHWNHIIKTILRTYIPSEKLYDKKGREVGLELFIDYVDVDKTKEKIYKYYNYSAKFICKRDGVTFGPSTQSINSDDIEDFEKQINKRVNNYFKKFIIKD